MGKLTKTNFLKEILLGELTEKFPPRKITISSEKFPQDSLGNFPEISLLGKMTEKFTPLSLILLGSSSRSSFWLSVLRVAFPSSVLFFFSLPFPNWNRDWMIPQLISLVIPNYMIMTFHYAISLSSSNFCVSFPVFWKNTAILFVSFC